MPQEYPVVAIDGPSGAGKGTLCQMLASHFNWHLLDSGALYRVLALAATHHAIPLDDDESLASIANHLDVQFVTTKDKTVQIILEGEDVSHAIRAQEVAQAASKVAAFPSVREALLRRQRAFRQAPGLIADGRDMGSVVFKDTPIKIFLTASAEERAQRRYKQLQEKQFDVNIAQLLSEIKERDERDMNRAVAPLIPMEDALVVDSTVLSIEEVFAQVLSYIETKLKEA